MQDNIQPLRKSVAPASVSLGQIYRGVLPFIALQLVTLAWMLACPRCVTWLPGSAWIAW